MQGNVEQASLGIAALSTLPSGQDLIKQVLAATAVNPQVAGKAVSGAAGQGKANTGNLVNAVNQVTARARARDLHRAHGNGSCVTELSGSHASSIQ